MFFRASAQTSSWSLGLKSKARTPAALVMLQTARPEAQSKTWMPHALSPSLNACVQTALRASSCAPAGTPCA